MKTPTTKTDRLSCRITPDHKRLLERAAARVGLSVTDYLVSKALSAAQVELREDEPIRLSAENWDTLLATLENPPPATPEFIEAMARFKEGHFEGGRYHG
jgi:uncharacterized protein (DUF1778 family)